MSVSIAEWAKARARSSAGALVAASRALARTSAEDRNRGVARAWAFLAVLGVMVNGAWSRSSTASPPSSVPVRILGPCKSWRMDTGLDSRRETRRRAAMTAAWSAWVPCEIVWGDAHAGRTETSLMEAIAPGLVRRDRAEAGATTRSERQSARATAISRDFALSSTAECPALVSTLGPGFIT